MPKTVTVPANQITVLQVVDESPEHYWLDPGVRLYFTSNQDRSVDKRGKKNGGGKQNTHREYVAEMQDDLHALGYLIKKDDVTGIYNKHTEWAVRRFTRRASQVYRMKDGKPDDVADNEVFSSGEQSVCDALVAGEIRKWIEKGWTVPVGRFPKSPIGWLDSGKPSKATDRICWTPEEYDAKPASKRRAYARVDAANAWLEVIECLFEAGAAMSPYYDSSPRPISVLPDSSSKSIHSFHYTGRAVDVDQGLVNGGHGPWFLVPEKRKLPNKNGDVVERQYFRIYSRAQQQDGTQGTAINIGEGAGPPGPDGAPPTAAISQKDPAARHYIDDNSQKEVSFKAGYYVDVTCIIEANGFVAIPAHENWRTVRASWEFWHFNYNAVPWGTFLDECELMEIETAEENLRAGAWSKDSDLDAAPG